ncbi:MAG: dihydroorotase [Pedobacter sp.]|nr:MAG: dihydroorotase [Pedobacter sp.]
MNLFVKSALIKDPASNFNNKVCDVRVEKGMITAIGAKLEAKPSDTVFDASNAILSPGFFDLNCTSGDPGFETREDLNTLTDAALAGGFTGIAVMPGTKPVVQTSSAVAYVKNRTLDSMVDVYPIGAISLNNEGKELAELFDMHNAGAVAFADGNNPITDDGFMSRALQYAKGFNGMIFSFPENRSIAGKAMINESSNSIMLGMKGNPALAEEMQIARDIFLATYHDTSVHITSISTAGAVGLIKKAKKDGVKITCDVAAHHLLFTENELEGFDSNFKVKPPLRGKSDVKALIAGLKDGTIDAISSQHTPHEIEFKDVEFETAAYGMIALQTVLNVLLKAGLDPELIVDKLSVAPRKILNLSAVTINEGSSANFVAYDAEAEWGYNSSNNRSRSENSPLLGTQLIGKVLLTVNKNKMSKYE